MKQPKLEPSLADKAKKIKLLLLDVDGVLTDGKLYFSSDNVQIKAFHTLDGHGIKLLKRSGVEVGIISGRENPAVTRRAGELGITLLIQGREDKYQALEELLREFPCPLDRIAYMGDDYPDLLVMTRVGLALSVPNAVEAVRYHAHWISTQRGGEGAVREACDMIMIAQNTYADALAPYISATTGES